MRSPSRISSSCQPLWQKWWDHLQFLLALELLINSLHCQLAFLFSQGCGPGCQTPKASNACSLTYPRNIYSSPTVCQSLLQVPGTEEQREAAHSCLSNQSSWIANRHLRSIILDPISPQAHSFDTLPYLRGKATHSVPQTTAALKFFLIFLILSHDTSKWPFAKSW